MPYSKKPRFNISYILQETGLKADTVRAWERRYMLPQPARSSGGQRLYSEYDLHTLIWLLNRQEDGMRIGEAAAYWREQMEEGLDPLSIVLEEMSSTTSPLISVQNDSLEDMQDKWLELSFLFKEKESEQILSQAFAQYPVHTVCTELILPGLRKVGDLWASGDISVQQEHFISEITTRKLQALISAAPNPTQKKNILIGNPPGEHHTIILLMMTLLLKNRGWQVIYLGANIPQEDLLKTINMSKVDLAIMNASRLATSAALRDSIRLLHDNGTPVAYSGWIFSQLENLHDQFPGLYLGDDLCEAVNKVEHFLNNPTLITTEANQNIISNQLVEKLHKAEPQITERILDRMFANNQEIEPDLIIKASRDLIADISAALSLGSIEYILTDLDWISKLMTSRNFSEVTLQTYLSIFTETIEEILGPETSAIVHHIDSFSQGLTKK